MHGCMMDGLYHSSDGGHTWSPVPWPAGAGFCPMPGPSVALAAGRVVATVTSNLAACAPPATAVVAGAATAGALHLAGRLQAPSVEAIGVMGIRLWAVSQDAFLVSADGGRTWRSLWPAAVPTQALAFTSTRDGLGAGSVLNPGCALATDDGGRTWHTESCLPLWQITALDAVNSRVAYLAGIGFGGGTSSELWRTGDGGRTWRRVRTIEGTVDALRLNAAGAGTVVLSTFSGRFGTEVEALAPDGGGARMLASAPDMLQATTVAPSGTAYAITAEAPAGGALLALGRHLDETLASLPTLSWAAASVDGHGDLVAALGVPFPAPGGSRTFGHAYRTELLSCTRGTWRLARLPTVAGAPVAVDFQDANQGWLLTDGMPGVPVLWHTVDGGRSWTALSP
jgi:hypothetical protein